MSATVEPPPRPPAPPAGRSRLKRGTSLLAHGEPMVRLTGGALALCLAMISGLLALVLYKGGSTFWVKPIVRLEAEDGRAWMGVVTVDELYTPEPGEDGQPATPVRRRMLRTANFEETGTHFDWIDQTSVVRELEPEWAVAVEREDHGHFFGIPSQLTVEGEVLSTEPVGIWERFVEIHKDVRERLAEVKSIEDGPMKRITRRREAAELAIRRAKLDHGPISPQVAAAEQALVSTNAELEAEALELGKQLGELREMNSRYGITFEIADGRAVDMEVSDIVRAVPANRLSTAEKLSVYADRWKEFLFEDPRKANSQGGVWPALFGTVAMTLIMSVLVVPFGVLAALYLREYAKQGMIVSTVRIAVNNLAGVPSIVFGVFGLGFFCYVVGASIDDLFFPEYAPNPKYGKGGILWASLTLALLTLPVVIVATEEALSAVPNSMREGSYACGATKWQTIRRIVLPRAMPGIMTGMVLAVARGAGEVAPLMLVGAVKYSPSLALDFSAAPYVYPERSFMHLGYHIFDVAFHSQDSEASKPMVYTTTLLLIGIVVALNLVAIWIRARLRRRFRAAR